MSPADIQRMCPFVSGNKPGTSGQSLRKFCSRCFIISSASAFPAALQFAAALTAGSWQPLSPSSTGTGLALSLQRTDRAGSISDDKKNNEGAEDRCMGTGREGRLRTYTMRRGKWSNSQEAVQTPSLCGRCRRGRVWKEAGRSVVCRNRVRDLLCCQGWVVLLLPAHCPGFRAVQPALSCCRVPRSICYFQNTLL